MSTVKTAISLQQSLFDQAEDLARTMKVSRSRLFAMALDDYIQRQENRKLLNQINAAYSEKPDSEATLLHRKSKRLHRKMVEGEW